MPHIILNNARLNVAESGTGSETLVLLHGLLFSQRMFDTQVEAMQSRFHCVRMDFRGQGASEVTRSGYDLDTLADDVIALIEHVMTERSESSVHLLGFSMGAMVAMRVALKRPELLKSLVLMNSSAEREKWYRRPRFELLDIVARLAGFGIVIPRILPLMFSDRFIEEPEHEQERNRWIAMVNDNDRIGATRAVHGVVSRRSVLDRIHEIRQATLVITADQDRATPAEHARNIHQRIAGSRMVMIENSGHMTTAEQPEAVNRALAEFYEVLAAAN
jgi:pimeloyl-ACP methyl ester carboxylesterase